MHKSLINCFQLHRLISQTLKIKSSERQMYGQAIDSKKSLSLLSKKHPLKLRDKCFLIKNCSPSLKVIHTDRPGVQSVTRTFFLVAMVLKIGQLSKSIRCFNFLFPYLN